MKKRNPIVRAPLFAYALRESWLPFLIITVYAIISAIGVTATYSLLLEYDISILSIESFAEAGIGLLPIAVLFFTIKSLAYYTKRCDSDFFESLPYTRTQVFFSYAAALSLLTLLAILVSTAGSLIAMSELIANNVFLVGDSVLYLLDVLVMSELAIAVALLSLSLSGHFVNVIVAAFIILGIPESVWSAFVLMAESTPLLTGVVSRANILATPSVVSLLIETAVTLLVGFIALILFKRRKSEIATRVYANNTVGHVLRVGITLPIMLVISLGVYFDDLIFDLAFVTTIVIFGLIVYFGYELIAVREKRAFLSALKGLPFLVIATALVLGSGAATGAVMSAVIPTEDTIRYVSILPAEEDYYADDLISHVARSASSIRLDEDEAKKIVADTLRENDEALRNGDYEKKYQLSEVVYYPITVEIGLPVGSVTRNLLFTEEEYAILAGLLSEREDYVSLFTDLPTEPIAVVHRNDWGTAQISRADAERVYEALLRDVSSMDFETWYNINADFYNSKYILSVVTKSTGEAYMLDLPISESTPEAYALMKAAVGERIEELHAELCERVTDAMEGGELEIGVEIYIGDEVIYEWLTVDSSEEGRAVGEFILRGTEAKEPDFSGDYIAVGIYESGSYTSYVSYTLTEEYTLDDIKSIFYGTTDTDF